MQLELKFTARDPRAGELTLVLLTQEKVTTDTLTFYLSPQIQTNYMGREKLTILSPVQKDRLVEHSFSFRVDGARSFPLRFKISVEKSGTYQFDIRARSPNLQNEIIAGHRHLYLLADGKSLKVLTPAQFMRQKRLAAGEELKKKQRAQPKAKHNMNDFLDAPVLYVNPPREINDKRFFTPLDNLIPQGQTPLDKFYPTGSKLPVTDYLTGQAQPAPLDPHERPFYIDRTKENLRERNPLTIRGRVLYRDLNNRLQPFANASVYLMEDDFGADELIAVTITGWDGRFTAKVNNDNGWLQGGRDIHIRIKTTNTSFHVRDDNDSPYWTYAWRANLHRNGKPLHSDSATVDFGSLELLDYQNAAQVFQSLNQGWNYMTMAGGRDPGFVACSFPADGTRFNTSGEKMEIDGDDYDSRDMILHEYGHAIMYNAFNKHWPSNTEGSHSFGQLLHKNKAWTEGWGTFIALVINPDGRYNCEPNDTGRDMENYTASTSQDLAYGHRDEGRVAAALLDLRGLTGDGHDGNGRADDNNSSHRASLSTIWRDTMWNGNYNDVFDFWNAFALRLTNAQTQAAAGIFKSNGINVILSDAVAEDSRYLSEKR